MRTIMPDVFVETQLQGLPVSAGIACAPVCILDDAQHTRVRYDQTATADAAAETARLHAALDAVAAKLGVMAADVTERIGRAEGEIFAALRLMVEDPSLRQKLANTLATSNCSAEAAVIRAFDAYAAQLQALGDDYIRERAADMHGLKTHVLEELAGNGTLTRCQGVAQCARGRDRIIVTRELSPTQMVTLDLTQVRGIVTQHGGATAHAAILARALGIPMVAGVAALFPAASCGVEALINGTTGAVVLWPSATTRAQAATRAVTAAPAPARVPDFAVYANISTVHDLPDALAHDAEGIGLYRTEYEFLVAGAVLDEDTQYERYATIVTQLRGRPVYIRLLDIGGDKELSFLDVPRESNPQLGCRGVRFLLAHPELFAVQARALQRAAQHGPLGVLYPMISSAAQFSRARQLFEDAVADLPAAPLQHGVLFEIPAACLEAATLLRLADFGSIGTNDLLQYLCAVDRNNDAVAADYVPDRPAFWRLLELTLQAAQMEVKPLSVCGELAGDPQYTAQLLRLGFRCVSTNARAIATVRAAARQQLHAYRYTRSTA
jgi:phosphotransferase system enzyme I (PtsI)